MNYTYLCLIKRDCWLYNSTLPNKRRIIHQHSSVLYSSYRCKGVFTIFPLVAYRPLKNISDILVRAKLPEPINTDKSQSPFGSFRCNKTDCTTCPFIEVGLDQYTFYIKTYQIKSHMTCELSNVVYMHRPTSRGGGGGGGSPPSLGKFRAKRSKFGQ